MGAPRAPVLQAGEVVGDLPRRPVVPPRAARAAHRHLNEPALPSAEPARSFTIAAFNAHWGVGRIGNERGVRYDAAAAILALDAEVVVVPESFRFPDGPGILDPLREAGYAIERVHITRLHDHRGFDDVRPKGDWDLAVCSKLPIRSTKPLPIGHFFRDPAGFRSGIECVVEVDGTPVTVVGFHASSKVYLGAPLWHMRNLKPQLPSLDEPAVIAGDCNFWGPGVVAMLRGWRRAVRGRTYPAHRPHSQIDHILVSRRIDVLTAEVRRVGSSDHRAIRAELAVR